MEVVFLPYKASMFDSLESIWLVAKDDPDCNAYVIPIPYYDRLLDGSFGKMHYEGDLYPDYIPVVDWQTYNIEENRPDIIFIHNPYDNGNKVTSIHPNFYAKQLKKFTKLLVYVPYFVCVDDVEEHFCVNLAVLYADLVIVQSERIRRAYIKHFWRFEEENNYINTFGKAEEKFIALGSPKFDKVLTTKREDCKIPKEWQSLISNSNGVQKKIVLYNTGISGLLNNNDKALRKMQSVFDFFTQRDDIILLWRPHPLNVETCNAMRPRFLKEYQEIVERYKRDNIGIYDDTPNLNRAITISDAYYGDWSSLVSLYMFTGKPVMIQNCDILTLNGLIVSDFFIEEDNFWLCDNFHNALLKTNRITGQTEFVCSFPVANLEKLTLFGTIAEHDGLLYFAPCSAENIVVFDKKTGAITEITIKEPKRELNPLYYPSMKFYGTVLDGDSLFFIPLSYPAIIRYHLITGAVEYFSDWVKPLDELHESKLTRSGVYFRVGYIVNNRNIVLASENTNAVVIFNMDTCKSEVYEVGRIKFRYAGICFDGKDYWLSPAYGSTVVRWNYETQETKEFYRFPCELNLSKIDAHIWDILFIDGYVYLFPLLSEERMFRINVKDETISLANEFKTDYDTEPFDVEKESSGFIYAYAAKSSILIEYSINSKKRRDIPIVLSDEYKKAVAKQQSAYFIKAVDKHKTITDYCYIEKNQTCFNDFLNFYFNSNNQAEIKRLEDKRTTFCKKINAQQYPCSGFEIYKYCKTVVSTLI